MAAAACSCFAGTVGTLMTNSPLTIMLTALLLMAAAVVKTAINGHCSRPRAAQRGKLCFKEVSPPPHTAMYGKQLRKFGENLQK